MSTQDVMRTFVVYPLVKKKVYIEREKHLLDWD